MRYATFEVAVPVDEDMLAEHVKKAEERGGPYTADFDEWDCADLFRAADHGIVTPDEGELHFLSDHAAESA